MSQRIKLAIAKLQSALGRGPQKSLEFVHGYWRSPPDECNHPVAYLEGSTDGSEFLSEKILKHAGPASRILEIGCNAGRNLAVLRKNGLSNLAAIEINQAAVDTLRSSHPNLSDVTITVKPIEEVVKDIPDNSYDVIYTMAVLEHIHFKSDWIFAEMVRISPLIITIEDEVDISTRHFPRNYQKVFEPLGMKQIDFDPKVPGFHDYFKYRAFRREY